MREGGRKERRGEGKKDKCPRCEWVGVGRKEKEPALMKIRSHLS